jgi:hypothetical protein
MEYFNILALIRNTAKAFLFLSFLVNCSIFDLNDNNENQSYNNHNTNKYKKYIYPVDLIKNPESILAKISNINNQMHSEEYFGFKQRPTVKS